MSDLVCVCMYVSADASLFIYLFIVCVCVQKLVVKRIVSYPNHLDL